MAFLFYQYVNACLSSLLVIGKQIKLIGDFKKLLLFLRNSRHAPQKIKVKPKEDLMNIFFNWNALNCFIYVNVKI